MMATAATLGLNKVFILDKYFAEVNKPKSNYNYNQQQHHHDHHQQQQQQPYKLNDRKLNSHLHHHSKHQSTTDNINDLIHLEAPITEDSLIRSLHTRFLSNEYFTNIGPVLIALNPYRELYNPLTLDSAHRNDNCYPLYRIVHEAVRQQTETGYPQVIILSGISGSGKTYASMTILRQLFNLVGGGPETDAFKHLAAAFTVLRSLGSACTGENRESSRIGNFIEVQITDGAIYRTKIHCYFLDQSRVVKTIVSGGEERNYHIFYQMLLGLSLNEKTKLYLDGYNIEDFSYLNNDGHSLNGLDSQSIQNHVNRFEAWKSCLSVLGIPFMDVARVLAAILLLGNIRFDNDDQTDDLSSFNKKELHAVASLLGVSTAHLHKGLTQRTYCSPDKEQIRVMPRNSHSFYATRDSLAKALYTRTVATIIRRANSSKRLTSTCGTASSESNDSTHNQHLETASSHHAASSIGSACGKSYKSMAVLQNAIRYSSMEGFIGILDMFGFEDARPSRLEQLCINLCAETMQHFYNTHIFKSSIESCRDEGIKPDLEIDYVDNVPCIDLISSLRTGLFSLIDYESINNGTAESLVAKQSSLHGSNSRYLEMANMYENDLTLRLRSFGIRHFYGNVIYDTSDFIESNSDRLSDDVVTIFHKAQCSFGFASHLFGSELRVLKNRGMQPLGIQFRISPVHTPAPVANSKEPPTTTFTQDFHSRLDNLLRILVHARPHFIRCIKINDREQCDHFDRFTIMRQIRALQVLETVNLMAEGLPHRMRFKAFISRYRLLVHSSCIRQNDDTMLDDCRVILDHFDQIHRVNSANTNRATAALTSWTLGRKHVFLSESARQQLEIARNGRRNAAATTIQALWRGYRLRQQWSYIKQVQMQQQRRLEQPMDHHQTIHKFSRPPRPQPISFSTPPPLATEPPQTLNLTGPNHVKSMDMYDFNLIKETCLLLGIDPNTPPSLPSSRSYTIMGNQKFSFPQTRTLRMDFIGKRIDSNSIVKLLIERKFLQMFRSNESFEDF
ncbi:Myosin X-like protein [Euroglyphus maynei]|uniref:Myosin X-like protein n=1 Tax=Euroglyphus maynei TaxID=6958 RepID=A0A1Y3BC59_EURMA|nr:Myosin X-like protein [Euroglyphus maynei]